jgi:hypothetical protein
MTSSTCHWDKAVKNTESDKSDVWSKRSTAQNSVATPLPKGPSAVYSALHPFGPFPPFHCRVHRISQWWRTQQAQCQDPTVCNSWLNVYAPISQTATSLQALRLQFCIYFSLRPSRYICSLVHSPQLRWSPQTTTLIQPLPFSSAAYMISCSLISTSHNIK